MFKPKVYTVLIFLLAFAEISSAQIYKAHLVCSKNGDSFKIIDHDAYLNYQPKQKIAELLYRDTLYSYQIKPTGKPKNLKRFGVVFKRTEDYMLWNITDSTDFVFAFKIGDEVFWFRELSTPRIEEYQQQQRGKTKKTY